MGVCQRPSLSIRRARLSRVSLDTLVEYGTLTTVRDRLLAQGVEITAELDFGHGNHAIYFSDPDGHVVELTERRTDWAGAAMSQ